MRKLFINVILYFYLLISFCFSGCEKELPLDIPVEKSRLVVEGWIENGENPEIILSMTAPYFAEIDSYSILDYAVSRAKVTVFSDSLKEILTLQPNKNYFPPLVYRGVEFTGEVNKTYSLEIIYQNDTIIADTRIPEPVELDSVWFQLEPGKDSTGQVWIKLKDDGTQDNFYRILFMREGKDKRYIPPFTSVFNDKFFNGSTIDLGFLRGFSNMLEVEQDNNFKIGDTISVKFCSLDREQFDFWNTYQLEIIASVNPFAASNFRIKSNIEGGLGIWGGYSATYYTVVAK